MLERRSLGRTGLQVSSLGFGASSLGGVFRDIDESEGIRTVHHALDLGINLIDVAPYYGLTKAETVLGRALRGVQRDRYVLATKCGRYGPEAPDFDFTGDRITRSIDESLGRLGVDHVDLIQAHDVEFGDLDVVVEECIPAMRRAVEAGKARFVGITGLPLEVVLAVVDRVDAGSIDTVLSYCRYGLHDTALLDALPALEAAGIGVINASPLAMGLLTHRGAPAWHPAPKELQAACEAAAELCERRGARIEKLAVQYAVAELRIASTLVSSASPARMQSNVEALSDPIDEELLADVLAVLEPVHNQSWPSGIQENR
ncbi:aldo/keto reductase [Phycisphaera mikurensis]|uniref:L-galactose dehydrogenase n=1 Tax=Phycisphaera mikurensis (strain NBRC 102666 / KCTC 22515 / FYK2301M01) TaxID=1142394 RepID=I0IEV4_PHYMF|nr:aldo/keto reductase [Phycisphaera mikurensis]MBB6441587.1 L-galactose dehydrogenase [Phycisphaera mikurensis]BAM03792.1 L-galactose dehydrogenase [Phycisphaera mikurensis NBRC 102666]